ncbi:MAG: hypothetical protein JW384_02274 [Nitrosomonadaceae bacterium]|nr:hypothetical protein [Nitrosomonadaceae bacterium]
MNLAVGTKWHGVVLVVNDLPRHDGLGTVVIRHTSLRWEVVEQLDNIHDHMCHQLRRHSLEWKSMTCRPGTLFHNTYATLNKRLMFVSTGQI